jgi:hypothetical protein
MRNCEYTKPNGEFCGSPALRGRDYCHWHLTCVARRLRAEKQEAIQDRSPLELPPLEDANSIQLAIMTVTDAMLRNRIGPRMSGQLLYALQLASCNLKQGVCFQPGKQAAGDEQKTQEVILCSSYDSLEADYDIHEHAEQLKATNQDDRLAAQGEPPAQPEPELSEVEQFIDYIKGRDYAPACLEPGDPDFDREFISWQISKQQQAEAHKLHWDGIRRDLAAAAGSPDLDKLKDLVADCYRRAGLQYEAEGWKPAAPQKVLFPSKPPENVQKEWYEQRKANCSAEFDRIAEREAAQKKIG